MRLMWFLAGALVTYFGIRFSFPSPLEIAVCDAVIMHPLREEQYLCKAELQDCKSLLVEERLRVDQLNLVSLLIHLNELVNSTNQETVDRFLKRVEQTVFELLEECPVD